jgi:hypothetical protein
LISPVAQIVCLEAPWPAAFVSITGTMSETAHAWWSWLCIWAKLGWSLDCLNRYFASFQHHSSTFIDLKYVT